MNRPAIKTCMYAIRYGTAGKMKPVVKPAKKPKPEAQHATK